MAVLVAAALVPLAAGDPERYAALAAALAIMVGTLLLIGRSIRAGVVTRLLSAPVLTGYLAGSAVIIIITQLPRVTGIPGRGQYRTVLGGLLHNLDQSSWRAVVLAAVTALVGLVSGAVSRRLPAALLALSVLGRLLDDLTDAGAALVLARVRTSVRDLMRRTGLEERIGAQNFHLTVAAAVAAQAVVGAGAPALPLPVAE